MWHALTQEIGARFAGIALGHVSREYPNKPDHTLAGPEDARTPSSLHPVFYGSYDWHSCVHGYWLLARLLRLFPAGPRAAEIEAMFDRQLIPEKVAAECAYLAAHTAHGFKRPYGWAWLLKLADELGQLPEPRWARALSPLAEAFAQRFRDFLPIAPYPERVGTHFNTAFALRMAADYAEGTSDAALLGLLVRTGERWYGEDADCPAWGEPGGDDFLSSALMEAECMRRLLPPARFLPWFDPISVGNSIASRRGSPRSGRSMPGAGGPCSSITRRLSICSDAANLRRTPSAGWSPLCAAKQPRCSIMPTLWHPSDSG